MTLDRRILAVVLMASLGTMLTACQREGHRTWIARAARSNRAKALRSPAAHHRPPRPAPRAATAIQLRHPHLRRATTRARPRPRTRASRRKRAQADARGLPRVEWESARRTACRPPRVKGCNMNPIRAARVLLAAIFGATALACAAQGVSEPDARSAQLPQTSGSIPYLTGGVGFEERDAMRRKGGRLQPVDLARADRLRVLPRRCQGKHRRRAGSTGPRHRDQWAVASGARAAGALYDPHRSKRGRYNGKRWRHGPHRDNPPVPPGPRVRS